MKYLSSRVVLAVSTLLFSVSFPAQAERLPSSRESVTCDELTRLTPGQTTSETYKYLGVAVGIEYYQENGFSLSVAQYPGYSHKYRPEDGRPLAQVLYIDLGPRNDGTPKHTLFATAARIYNCPNVESWASSEEEILGWIEEYYRRYPNTPRDYFDPRTLRQ